jgi:hypothetical protein
MPIVQKTSHWKRPAAHREQTSPSVQHGGSVARYLLGLGMLIAHRRPREREDAAKDWHDGLMIKSRTQVRQVPNTQQA